MNPHEWKELESVDGLRVFQHVETGHIALHTGGLSIVLSAGDLVRVANIAVQHPRFDEQLAIAHVRSNPRLALYRVRRGILWDRKDRIA